MSDVGLIWEALPSPASLAPFIPLHDATQALHSLRVRRPVWHGRAGDMLLGHEPEDLIISSHKDIDDSLLYLPTGGMTKVGPSL